MTELTILELQAGMQTGELTARSITEIYLRRIAELDQAGPTLNSVIEINPDALDVADALDTERRDAAPAARSTASRSCSKTTSTPPTGCRRPPAPWRCSARSRGAGCHGRAQAARGRRGDPGQNQPQRVGEFPLDPFGQRVEQPRRADAQPVRAGPQPVRLQLGSGVAVAANLCAAAVGTETDGSIICPSHANGIVGIKPTLGLVSRAGIIPIAHSQDTAGPMARTVADAAILLAALIGPDLRDPATLDIGTRINTDDTDTLGLSLLDRAGLCGARIGVARNFCRFNPRVDAVFETSLAALRDTGAVIVDPTDIETVKQIDEPEYEVLLYEFKADLDAYLAGLGSAAPVHSLADVIAFNEANRDASCLTSGRSICCWRRNGAR